MTYVPALLTVFVPAGEDTYGIKPGSAMVGSPTEDGTFYRVDYEGNQYDAVNMRSYEDCLYHAADRHVWNEGRGYPTVARMLLTDEELHAVGTYDPVFKFLEIEDQEALDAWKKLWKPGR